MTRRNAADAPSADSIRNAGAIPQASQISNDSNSEGESVAAVLNNLGDKLRKTVTALDIVTLNDEQSVALGGDALHQWAPVTAVVQITGVGGTIAGDAQITIGITTGGTEILAATALTGAVTINEMLIIDLSAVAKPAIPANSTVFVKVTSADSTGTAGSLASVHLMGEIIDTAS